MPYFCHVGGHLYQASPDVDGCQVETCRQFAEVEVESNGPFFGAVPGGTRAGAKAKKISGAWHNDMYAYEKARNNGLEPDQVNVKASAKVWADAEKEAAS